MSSSFQASILVASPSYPNSVAWSEENLVAVASGHIVTILNPAKPFGSRGLITLPPGKPFSVGLIDRKVCTTEGHVRLYRMPFLEFSAEWVEVMDISHMLYSYLTTTNFQAANLSVSEVADPSQACFDEGDDDDLPISIMRKQLKRRRLNALPVLADLFVSSKRWLSKLTVRKRKILILLLA